MKIADPRKTKILTVVFSFGKGGTERAAQNFATGYSEIGCDSRILCTKLDGPRRHDLENWGIPVYFLVNDKNCQEIIDWCPDIVHIHSHGLDPKEFYSIHDLCPAAKFVETNVFSRPSPWAKQLLISFQLSQWCNWLFAKRSNHKYKSAILPNPVDTEAYCRASPERRSSFRSHYGLLETDLIIGRVGQNFDGKWSSILIEVFEEIRATITNLKLLLVNPPQSILNRALGSQYSKDIVHIQRIEGDIALVDCYSSIDVFVLIARQGESFGMVISESLLCETPVVALATPWADNSQGEVLGNRIGGFVAATKYELKALIEHLISNKKIRVLMGRAGRERTIKMFDKRFVSEKSLDILSSGENHESIALNPFEIFDDSIGSIDVLSRQLLKSRSHMLYKFLEYSLGYDSWLRLLLVKIPSKLFTVFRRHFLMLYSNSNYMQ